MPLSFLLAISLAPLAGACCIEFRAWENGDCSGPPRNTTWGRSTEGACVEAASPPMLARLGPNFMRWGCADDGWTVSLPLFSDAACTREVDVEAAVGRMLRQRLGSAASWGVTVTLPERMAFASGQCTKVAEAWWVMQASVMARIVDGARCDAAERAGSPPPHLAASVGEVAASSASGALLLTAASAVTVLALLVGVAVRRRRAVSAGSAEHTRLASAEPAADSAAVDCDERHEEVHEERTRLRGAV